MDIQNAAIKKDGNTRLESRGQERTESGERRLALHKSKQETQRSPLGITAFSQTDLKIK